MNPKKLSNEELVEKFENESYRYIEYGKEEVWEELKAELLERLNKK